MVGVGLDVFEQRAPFEEGRQISDGHDGFRLESEPCERGKVEVAEVRAKITQRETRKLREKSSKNGATKFWFLIGGFREVGRDRKPL